MNTHEITAQLESIALREWDIQWKPTSRATFMKIGQAAATLGVAISTVRDWIDQGKLPARITPGGHRLILETDVRQFAARMELNTHEITAQLESIALRLRANQQGIEDISEKANLLDAKFDLLALDVHELKKRSELLT
jgi:excisionase family DNA binding protein